MGPFRYYHNPRCSKSRQGLKLLEEKGAQIEVIEYLKETPTASQFLELLGHFTENPLSLIRQKEARFKELNLDASALTLEQWAAILAENPILLERPVLQGPESAVIGRPPENLLGLI